LKEDKLTAADVFLLTFTSPPPLFGITINTCFPEVKQVSLRLTTFFMKLFSDLLPEGFALRKRLENSFRCLELEHSYVLINDSEIPHICSS
jgi:hypothetical protein